MASVPIQIVILRPQGYPHSEMFTELAETLRDGFRALGTETTVAWNTFRPDTINLVLAWHLLTEAQEASLPNSCILYNLEQMDGKNRHLLVRLKRLSERFEIWDYSRSNINILHREGVRAAIQHVPIGYMPILSRIRSAAVQDIDVLFYGSVNFRRKLILEALAAEGLKVKAVYGLYGKKRDQLVARSKVVLNLHYYEAAILEEVRLSYLWSNRKAVVSECRFRTDIPRDLEDAARFVPYLQLVKACKDLVADGEARKALEVRAFEVMSRRSETGILGKVLAGEAGVEPGAPPSGPVCSLVIPVFNKVEFTRQCLDALGDSAPAGYFETIVIDNASTDGTAAYLAGLGGQARVITNSENQGFVGACNQGAEAARGQYLVFLNNDTIPLPGWLEAMVAMAEQDSTVGAVGAQLV